MEPIPAPKKAKDKKKDDQSTQKVAKKKKDVFENPVTEPMIS